MRADVAEASASLRILEHRLIVVSTFRTTVGHRPTEFNRACTTCPPEPPSPEQTGFVNSKCHNRISANGQFLAWVPDRLYVGFDDSDVIQVLDPAQAGVIVNSIEGHHQSGTKKLTSFWRQ